MNILQMEDMVKGLPDQVLMQEAQMPSGQIPQFLALSEVQRRQEMRQRLQKPPEATVADQILQGGIASAMPQEQPMGPQGGMPPEGMPPMEPPVQMYAGGMVPSYMQAGGSVGAPEQAEVVRQAFSGKARVADFLRQNLTTPQGLGRLAAGAIGGSLGGPLAGYAASQGFNRLFPMRPSALEQAVQAANTAANPFGMQGQSFAQAGAARQADLDRAGDMALGNQYQSYLNRMTNPFGGTGSGIVRDERLGDDSLSSMYGMYGGGQVPGMVYMQAGQQVPNESVAQRRARLSAELRQATLAGDMARANEIRRELEIGLTPAGAMSAGAINQQISRLGIAPTMEAPPPISLEAPDFQIAAPPQPEMMAPGVQGQPPTGMPGAMPGAAPATDVTGSNVDIAALFPQARAVIGGRSSGMPQDLAGAMKPYEDILAIDPNSEVFKGPDFTSLIEEQRKRGSERAASYEQTIKGIENEMKRERLGAVLTTLAANLMAGEGALGLEKAGALAQQMGKEARQEIAAERRSARSAEDAASDRIFALNAQQLTADKEAQRALYTAQRGV